MLLAARLVGLNVSKPTNRLQAGLRRFLDQVAAQHAVHGGGALEQPPHPAHPLEQSLGETPITQQMIVEEIEVAAGQPLDLCQRLVDALRVEGTAAGEEGILVAEVAMLRAGARDDDRIGYEVAAPLDQVAADRRQAVDRAPAGGA